MVNTVGSLDIRNILKEYQKDNKPVAVTEEKTKYTPYHKMNRKERDIVDHVMVELQLKERVIADVAAHDLGESALDPGELD